MASALPPLNGTAIKKITFFAAYLTQKYHLATSKVFKKLSIFIFSSFNTQNIWNFFQISASIVNFLLIKTMKRMNRFLWEIFMKDITTELIKRKNRKKSVWKNL